MTAISENRRKTAILYRMEMDNHVCPYGLKSKWLLEREGFHVEDHPLTTRAETDSFKEKHNVKTTPQTFIEGERVGGYDALRERFTNWSANADTTSYTPVLVIFALCALSALALAIATGGEILSTRTLEWFAALTMTVLAIQKLQDVESFSTMFLNYDLLARRKVGYGYVYPVAEAAAGVLMLAGGTFALVGAPIALLIGTIGAVSVFKAVYLDKRELKCACVGGNSDVPLGFVSLTENLVMMAMGLWMIAKAVA